MWWDADGSAGVGQKTLRRWHVRQGCMSAALGGGLLLAAAALASAVPSAPPPGGGPSVGTGPGAAWVETAAGDRWLGSGGGCWAEPGAPPVCALVLPNAPGMPRIPMRAGEIVTFHLGFAPTGVVSLRGNIRTKGNRTLNGRAYRLGATTTVTWKVRGRSGRARLSAAGENGDASYLFDVVIRPR
jgi:hypothetical protein